MAPKPTKSIKDPGRIGADVFIRDPDDATIQYKARTLSINYDTKEADIGLFPRRWGTFSELHLPAEYRITVPLTELSLEPFAGAQQFGFEDVMIQRGETPPPPWMDNAGRTHQPGCEEPVAAAPGTVVGEDGTPEPEFGDAQAEPPAEPAAPAASTVLTDSKPMGNTAIGTDVIKPAETPKKAGGKKILLFSKEEIMAQVGRVKDEMDRLAKMVEAVL